MSPPLPNWSSWHSDLTSDEESLIENLLATVHHTGDSDMARLAALVRRCYRIKVPDSIIAATAMFTGSTLLTRNTRDFRKIPSSRDTEDLRLSLLPIYT